MDTSNASTSSTLQSGDDTVETDSYDRLKKLVEKTTKMRLEAPEHNRQADEYFKMLRQKLNDSSAFLKTAKNNIENIKTLFKEDHMKNLNSQLYLDHIEKTDQEIEEEMKIIQQKLDELQGRIHALKQGTKSRSFEEATNDTISTLDNVAKGTE